MDESLVISKFDSLVQSGLVLYDDKQRIIEHIEDGLKVLITPQSKHLLTRSRVPIYSDFCSRQKTHPNHHSAPTRGRVQRPMA